MTSRSARSVSVLASSLLMLMGAKMALAQTAGSATAATQQGSGQQPSLRRPKGFFPMAEQPVMEMHHHGEIPQVMPQFPRLGNSQRVVTGPIYQLEDLDRMATAHKPTHSTA